MDEASRAAGTEAESDEVSRLRARVAELEQELQRRPPASDSGNVIPIALKLIAVQAALVFAALLVTPWCNDGLMQTSGWTELFYAFWYLVGLTIPISVFTTNVLIINLWATPMRVRWAVAGPLALAVMFAITAQWLINEMDNLAVFVCGALLMAFAPAVAIRFLTRWRLQTFADGQTDIHGAARTLDLMVLTILFAMSIALLRWYLAAGNLELHSGYYWWLSGLNSLLPITAVAVTNYCSLRVMQGRNRAWWCLVAVLASLVAGGILMLQMISVGFASWDPLQWPEIVSIPADLTVIVAAFAVALLVVPILVAIPLTVPFRRNLLARPSAAASQAECI